MLVFRKTFRNLFDGRSGSLFPRQNLHFRPVSTRDHDWSQVCQKVRGLSIFSKNEFYNFRSLMNREYSQALMGSLQLNNSDLIQSVIERTDAQESEMILKSIMRGLMIFSNSGCAKSANSIRRTTAQMDGQWQNHVEYAVSSSLHGNLLNLIFPTLLKASISIIVRCFNDCYVMRTNNLISFKPSKLLHFKQSDFSVLAESSAWGERNADEESRGCGYFDGTTADRQLQGTANQ